MEIPGASVSAPVNRTIVRAGGNTYLPLNSGAQSGLFRLPDWNGGIPLDRETGKAIPLKREQTAFPLKSAEGNRDIEAEKAKLRKAAEGFEAIFIRQMLKTMRSTVPEGNLYGSGSTGEMYADMAESSLADALSKQGRFGIANTLYNRMVRRIEQRDLSHTSASPQVSPQDGGR